MIQLHFSLFILIFFQFLKISCNYLHLKKLFIDAKTSQVDMGNHLDNLITEDNSKVTQENSQKNTFDGNETIQETSHLEYSMGDNSQGMMDHSQMACSQGDIS